MSDSPPKTIVTVQFENGLSLLSFLEEKRRPDLLGEAENNFRKVLLLSVASYFEKEISDIVLKCAEVHANNHPLISGLIKSKAVSRQYFTYFDWDNSKNANKFFSLFGSDFKDQMADMVKNDDRLESAIRAFLQLGQDRNYLVHRNFAEFTIETTAKDIYARYLEAEYFVEILRGVLN